MEKRKAYTLRESDTRAIQVTGQLKITDTSLQILHKFKHMIGYGETEDLYLDHINLTQEE